MLTLLERSDFLAKAIRDANDYFKAEKSAGRPPHWEMVFWWTRKPLSGARTVIAVSLLPYSAYQDVGLFLNDLFPCRREKRAVHSCNPSQRLVEKLKGKKLLDPFAGFGSIPLEALRLGVDATAVELLPTAYVFLKAILEYPRLFGDKFAEVDGRTVKELGLEDVVKQLRGRREMNQYIKYRIPMLVHDVARWGSWVISKLKEDPVIRELYDEDVAVYIGTWEVRCPHCGRWTPIVGNWWLAKVRKGGSIEEEEGGKSEEYERLAWMEPHIIGDEVLIRIRDLNRELNRDSIKATVNSKVGIVKVGETTYRVQRPNVDAKKEVATCLLYQHSIMRKSKEDWYIKKALNDWNAKLEQYLSRAIDLQDLINKSLARPRLIAKLKILDNDLVFEPATREDDEKLWRALEKLRAIWGDPDIPIEDIAKYDNRSIWVIIYGFDKWFKLFNPRQLLTLTKLVKLIRQVGHVVEEEKLKESWNAEDAKKYAEAVTTYLAMALCKYADFNSMATRWNPGWLKFEESLSVRGIAMMWSWTDSTSSAPFTGSWLRSLQNIVEGLSYLVNAVSGSSNSVRVLLDDATSLSKVVDEKFDLVVTDPPYRDDVPYTELSDFYYVWLKRPLSDVVESLGLLKLAPRFHKDAFFEDYDNEIETQWKKFAEREVSEVKERAKALGYKNVNCKEVPVGSFDYFKYMLSESFKAMATRLKEDGVFVTYYAHTSPEAWEALLEAGWQGSGLRVSAAYALLTESPQRVTARGATTLDMSIAVAWRKGVSGEALADKVYNKAIESCFREATNYRKQGLDGVNLFVSVLGCTLSQFTQYEKVVGVKSLGDLVERYIYPATAAAVARSLTGTEAKLSPASQFYLLAKVLIDRGRRQRRVLDRTSATILSIGTGINIDELKKIKIAEKVEEGYGDLVLLEPVHSRDARGSVEELLSEKEVSPQATAFRTPVDALHVLEYLTQAIKSEELRKRVDELRASNGAVIDEAIDLAKILADALPEDDVEKEPAQRLLEDLGIGGNGLSKFI